MKVRIFDPLGLLVLWFLVLGGFEASYILAGVAVSQNAAEVVAYGMALGLSLWVVADARCRRTVPCFDFGFLACFFFPLSMIWYLLWTRGWRGMLLLVGFVGLIFVPWICAAMVWYLKYRIT